MNMTGQMTVLHKSNGKVQPGPSAANKIAQELSNAIISQKLVPGAKLGEDELAEVYDVSRTVIRSALQQLDHEKLVSIERHRGAFVAQPDPAEARDIMEARSLLEPRTARSAAERMTDDALSGLKARLVEEHKALDSGDLGRAISFSGKFHTDIAQIAQQPTIAEFIESLVARSSLIIALYWKRQSAVCEEFAHHALVEAFEKGEAQLAEELMLSHIVDLASSLDFDPKPDGPKSLKDILRDRG